MIHLDTSFLVDLLRENRRGDTGPATRLLDSLEKEELGISLFAACELYAGAELAADPGTERGKVDELCAALEIDHPQPGFATGYGKLLAQMRSSGDEISTMDLLIANSALLRGVPLITRNLRDFRRVPALEVRAY